MKVCSKCGNLQLLDDYFIRDKQTRRRHAQCKLFYKVHRRTFHKFHYAKYRQSYLIRASKRNEQIRSGLRKQMLLYFKDKKCVDCGFSDIRTLEFDHVHPESQLFDIGRGLTDGLNWDKILFEIKKCRIVCANCHKIRTAEQFNWYRLARWPRS